LLEAIAPASASSAYPEACVTLIAAAEAEVSAMSLAAIASSLAAVAVNDAVVETVAAASASSA
jgi:hypothetical protein